eukprot:scaffold9946_cov188-Amphora_coffeaeformis.AAC.5
MIFKGLLLVLWALRDAARDGDLVRVRDLVQNGAIVRADHHHGRYSPLHEASRKGHLPVVKYLVEEGGADVHATEQYAEATPLHEAVLGGHLDVLEYLIYQAQADLMHKDKFGQTALHKASKAGHLDLSRYLVNRDPIGRWVDAMDNKKMTPLMEACENGHLRVAEFLVKEARAGVHDTSLSGDTPLHMACIQGHVNVAKFLLQQANARVDKVNRDGQTPLDCARRTGVPELIRMLEQVSNGKNNNTPISNGSAAANGKVASSKKAALDEKKSLLDSIMPAVASDDEAMEPSEYKPEDTMVAAPKNEMPNLTLQPVAATEGTQFKPETVATKTEAKPAVVPQTMPQTFTETSSDTKSLPVKTRIALLEEKLSVDPKGTLLERVAAIERQMLGEESTSGTITSRLSKLEGEYDEWTRLIRLEVELQVVPSDNTQASLGDRITELELELLGQAFNDSLSHRLTRLEQNVIDTSRILRLEQELEIVSQGSRMERIDTLELALFGETFGGTTFASRLERLESELVGC